MTGPERKGDGGVNERRGDLSDFLFVLLKRRRFLVWNTVVVTAAALVISLLLTPMFTATTTILPPQEEGNALMGLGSLLQRFDLTQLNLTGATSSAQLYVAILKSRTVADSMVTRFDLVERYDVPNVERARKVLAAYTGVSLGSTGMIEVSVKDESPDTAAVMANTYVEILDRLNQTIRTTEGRRTRMFIEERLAVNRDSLRAAEEGLMAYQEEHPGMAVPPEAMSAAGAAADLLAQRVVLGYELELMKATLQPGSAPLAQKEAEVNALDRQLRALPAMGLEMARRYRDFKVQEKVFELLTAQLVAASIKEHKDITTVDVLDVAVPPVRKSSPRRGLITALAFVLSLVVGLVMAVSMEALERYRLSDDPRMRSVVKPGSLLDRILFGRRVEPGS